MQRRELLRKGILLAGSLGAGQAVEPSPTAAQSLSLSFFEGELRGLPSPGWTIVLSATGTRAQGFAHNVGAAPPADGLRLRGRLQAGRLTLQVYALQDVNLTSPIGALDGVVNAQGFVKGTLRLPDGTAGVHGRPVPVDLGASRALAGRYRGSIRNQSGSTLYAGDLTVRPDLSWELRNVQAVASGFPALGGAARRLTGRWGVSADGRVLLNITQVPLPLRSPIGSSAAPGAVRTQPGPGQVGTRSDQPGRVFSDGEFPDGNWTAVKILDDSPGQGATFQAGRSPEGGNPGAFRAVRHILPGGAKNLTVAHLMTGAEVSRGPADPPLGTAQFSYDGEGMPGFNLRPLVAHFPPTDGVPTYYAVAGPHVGEGWTRFDSPVLRLNADLIRVAGPGPDHPDPSAAGTFRFGFLSQTISAAVPGTQILEGHLDNFRVEITTEVPPPQPSLTLTGPDRVRAGSGVCYTATVVLPSGAPVEGAQVLFTVTGEDEATMLTDGSGEARFCFKTTGPGEILVIASLDRNGDGIAEPDEPSVQRALTVVAPGAPRITLSGSSLAFLSDTTTNSENRTLHYVATVMDELDTPLADVPVSFQLDPFEDPVVQNTIFNGTTEFLRIVDERDAERVLQPRAWLDLDGDGFVTPGEPSDTITTQVFFGNDGCWWICTLASILFIADVFSPNSVRPRSPTLRLQHPFLENLVLWAEPVG